MTTIVDALVVTLGLDSSKFEKGQKDTTASLERMREDSTTTAKEMQARGKQGAEFFGEMQKGAAALIAGGDLVKFAEKTVVSLSGIQRVSSAMNLPVEKLQAYTKWIERMGGSAAAAQSTLLGLSQIQASWQQGKIGNDQLYAMSKIGGTANDDPIELARKFAVYAHAASPKQAGQVTRFGMALGFDVDQIAALKAKGGAGMQSGMAASLVMSADQIDKANKAREAFENLKQELVFLAQELVIDTTGAAKFADSLAILVKRFPGATQAILGVAAAVVALGNIAAASWLLRAVGGGAAAARAGGLGGPVGLATGATGVAIAAYGANVAGPRFRAIEAAHPNHPGDRSFGRFLTGSWDFLTGRADFEGAAGGGGARRGGGGPGGQAAATGGGRQTLASAMAHLEAMGLSAAQAQGAAAAMLFGEGGWTAHTKNRAGSSAEGIGQWMRKTRTGPGRQIDFEKWAGHSFASSTIDEQYRFMAFEFAHKEASAYAAIRAAKTAREAALAYVGRYMRPGEAGTRSDMRQVDRHINITINAPSGDPKAIAHHVKRAVHSALTQQANAGLS